ncbi:MAG: hypothetical protein JNK85_03080 [Verrucomicrobiales bacterium]|nr:hypothetical protein [Verrucomicrobiales bacterium]
MPGAADARRLLRRAIWRSFLIPLLASRLGVALEAPLLAAQPDVFARAESLPTVRAVSRSVRFVPGPGEPAALAPGHPPLDTIPPLPIPELPRERTSAPAAERPMRGTMTRYDPRTGRVEEIVGAAGASGRSPSADPSPGGLGGGNPGLGATGQTETPLDDFAQFAKVPNTKADPWRMNVKLVMEYPLVAGGFAYFVASGAMLDAEVVVTAAHCVFNHDPTINNWASRIWVYPGWDGVSALIPAGPEVQPFGWAEGTSFYASTDFVATRNFDRDVGLVFLPRAVGMLTGWYGWAWGYDCTTTQARRYFNASYPSQSCGEVGLHNGKDMMYWSGSIDRCVANQLEITTSPGCYSAVWGGMSGSALYFADNGGRYVHGISSTSDRSVTARYCRLWQQFAVDLTGTLIPASRGPAFDLQALDCNVTSTNLPVGRPTTLRDHLVVNATDHPSSGTYTFRVYLSANDNISTADTLLAEQSYAADLPAMSALRVMVDPVILPAGTPPGDYWIGIEYDSATDGNPSNNDTDGWDAVKIKVLPGLKTLTVNATGSSAEVLVTTSPVDFDGQGGGTTPFDRSYSPGTVVIVQCPATTPTGDVFLGWKRNGVDWTNTPMASVQLDDSTVLTAVYQGSFLTVDNQDGPIRVELSGGWTASSKSSGAWGADYLHDGNTGKGTKEIRFIPTLPVPGSYEVFLWYTASSNRASNVPVEIIHATGVTARTLNQRTQGSQWVSLGTYAFSAGTSGRVRISNASTDGFVIADAVRWQAREPVSQDFLTVDNLDGPSRVEVSGAWASSASVTGFLGTDYWHDSNAGKGSKSVTFIPSVSTAGRYEAFIWYTAAATRSTNVPVDVVHADGLTTRRVNQQINGGQWVSLGTYVFDSGTSGRVTVRNGGTVGYVVADGIRLVPSGDPAPVVIDNADGPALVQLEGSWTTSSAATGFWAANYLHNGNVGKGTKSVSFVPMIPAAGNYDVSIWYAAGTNRATNVPVDIVHAGGTTTRVVNQRTTGSQWVSLGTYAFGSGTTGRVRIRTSGVNGYVVADAVQWVPNVSSLTPSLARRPEPLIPTPRLVRSARGGGLGIRPEFEVELDSRWGYAWEASTNGLDWIPIQEGRGSELPILLTDPESVRFPYRFYRLRYWEMGLANNPKRIY